MPDFSDKAIHDWLPLYNTLLPFYTGMDVLIENVRNHLAYEDAEKSTPKNISVLLAGDIPFIRAKDVLLNTASYPGHLKCLNLCFIQARRIRVAV
jgi:hypothetical protein